MNFDDAVQIATFGINPLTQQINDMIILTAEDRNDTAEMITQCKRLQKDLNAVKDIYIKPIKERVKAMELAIKPFEIQLKANIASIKKANERWDVKLLEAERAKKEAFEAEQERKSREAIDKHLAAKKAGEKTDTAVLKAIIPQAYKSDVATHKTAVGASNARLVDKWRIILADGSEWDKRSRLRASDLLWGDTPGLGGHVMRFLMIDAVAINECFKNDRENLPPFVEIYQGTVESVR